MGVFRRRARAKLLSAPLAVSLAELRSPLEQSYRNTAYCASVIVQADGKLQSRYCGNRWCLVCSRIRTGRAIDVYAPMLATWTDTHFVTLTVRNVKADDLPATVAEILRALGTDGIPKAMKRTHRLPLVAVRKLECTYSMDRQDYHPHVHMIVQGREAAFLLRDLWLKRFGDRAVIEAQDVRECDEQSHIELFKYFTKVVTSRRDGRRRMVPPSALDVIFRAMRGRRVWQTIGCKLPKEEESIEAERLDVEASAAVSRLDDTVFWQWDQSAADWIDAESGECLSGYEPSERFRAFVESIGEEPGPEPGKGEGSLFMPFSDSG